MTDFGAFLGGAAWNANHPAPVEIQSATVAPADQATTNTYADCGSLDATNHQFVAFTIVNLHATRGLHWKVLAGNQSNFADAITVKAEADVAGLATDSYSTATALYRYYKVQVQSGTADQPATAQVRGIAK